MAQQSYTTIDPSWNYRHLDRINQLLAAFMQRRQEEERKKEARFEDSLAAASDGVSRGADPSSPAYQSLLQDLERRNPQQASILRETWNAAAGKQAKVKRAESAYDRLVSGAEQEQRMMELLSAVGGGAAQQPGMAGLFGQAGNAMAQHNQQQNGGLSQLLQKSLQGMPAGEQLDVLPQLAQRGVDPNQKLPSPFDPYGGDLPPAVAGLLAAQQGKIGGEPVQALRYSQAIERTPQQLASDERAEATRTATDRRAEASRALTERRLNQADARERRLASAATGGQNPAKALKERREVINARAKEIRTEHAATQAVLPEGEPRTPPPNFRDARRQAVREAAPELSEGFGAVLEQFDQAKAAIGQQAALAGGTAVAARRGDVAAAGKLKERQRAQELVAALERAEAQALDLVAAGRDPDEVAGFLEEILAAFR